MKRIFSWIIVCCLLAGVCGCSTNISADSKAEQDRFDAFIEEDVISSIENDYISYKIYFENPEDYGINSENVEIRLGEYKDEESYQSIVSELQDVKKEFDSFNYKLLTDDQKDIYDAYKFDLDNNISYYDESYYYLENQFSTMSGIHTQLPTVFIELNIHDRTDFEELITLMYDCRPYVQSLLDYTLKQAENGIMMIDFDEVISYCQNIVDEGMNSSVLASLIKKGEDVNVDEKLIEDLKDAFSSSYLGAYQDIIDTLTMLQANYDNNEKGLYYLENGAEYYALLARMYSGNEYTIEDIEDLMLNAFEYYYNDMVSILTSNEQVYKMLFESEPVTSFTTYNEIIDYLNGAIKDDFPDVGTIEYVASSIDPAIAVDGLAAYYAMPAIDSTMPDSIKVNTSSGSSSVDMLGTYSTVAHEGIPGHMYQTNYVYQHFDNLYQKLNSSIAYTEGYATYVQNYAYKYLTDIDQEYLQVVKDNELISYFIIVLADIGIHYYGDSIEDTLEMLNGYGFSLDSDSVKPLYQQLQNNPGAFIPYYVGFIQIDNLKQKAMNELGSKYNDKAFHEALLQGGNTPLFITERNIEKFIKTSK